MNKTFKILQYHLWSSDS